MRLEDEFPQSPDLCYLNHAAVAPWPARARDAVMAFAQENARDGARDYPRWLKKESQLRERLAALVHAEHPRDIALVKNTSEALSMVAYGLDWQAGDEVVITNQEFPSNRMVWESLADQGVKVMVADLDGADSPEQAVEDCLSDRTRLLSVSSVQYGTGLKLDIHHLGKLCRQRDILYCVDAIQSIGAEPLDVQKDHIDFTMADGHKWMLGPEGLALFYIHPRLQASLRPLEIGWHSVEDRGNFDQKSWKLAADASRFECGSPNILGAHALEASVSLLLEVGLEDVQRNIAQRIEHLEGALSAIDGLETITPAEPARRAGIYTFRIDGADNQALQKKLMGSGVICAYRGGGIRFSPHFYTPEETLNVAVDRLKSHLQRG